jgi:hypothetical protein
MSEGSHPPGEMWVALLDLAGGGGGRVVQGLSALLGAIRPVLPEEPPRFGVALVGQRYPLRDVHEVLRLGLASLPILAAQTHRVQVRPGGSSGDGSSGPWRAVDCVFVLLPGSPRVIPDGAWDPFFRLGNQLRGGAAPRGRFLALYAPPAPSRTEFVDGFGEALLALDDGLNGLEVEQLVLATARPPFLEDAAAPTMLGPDGQAHLGLLLPVPGEISVGLPDEAHVPPGEVDTGGAAFEIQAQDVAWRRGAAPWTYRADSTVRIGEGTVRAGEGVVACRGPVL